MLYSGKSLDDHGKMSYYLPYSIPSNTAWLMLFIIYSPTNPVV